jgi:hypothetical protein
MARKLIEAPKFAETVSIQVNEPVQGYYVGTRQILNRDGTPRKNDFGVDMYVATLAKTAELKEVTEFWMDGGLRGTLSLLAIKPGTKIEIVKTGDTKQLDNGYKTNVYEVYDLT